MPKVQERIIELLVKLEMDLQHIGASLEVIASRGEIVAEKRPEVKRFTKPQPIQITAETSKYIRWDGAWKFDLLEAQVELPIFTAIANEMKSYGYVWSRKHHGFFKPSTLREGEQK